MVKATLCGKEMGNPKKEVSKQETVKEERKGKEGAIEEEVVIDKMQETIFKKKAVGKE